MGILLFLVVELLFEFGDDRLYVKGGDRVLIVKPELPDQLCEPDDQFALRAQRVRVIDLVGEDPLQKIVRETDRVT